MPVIPVYSLATLRDTVAGFQQTLVTSRATTMRMPACPPDAILPYCTTQPLLPDSVCEILRGTCHSISDLARAATTADGRQALADLLQQARCGTAQQIMDFWTFESPVL